MQIRPVLTRAAHTTWNHKRLWFYGVFAASVGGGVNVQLDDALGQGADLPAWLGPVLLVAGVAGVVFTVMHLVSEAALIEGVTEAQDGEPASIGRGLRSGWTNVGRVLGVKLATGLMMAVVAMLFVAPGLLAALGFLPLPAGIAGSVLLALPAVPVIGTLAVVSQLALRLVVLEGRPVLESLRLGRRMLHTGLVDTLALLVGVAAGRVGLNLLVALPAVVLAAVVAGPLYFMAGLVPALVAVGAVLVPVGIVLAGVSGAWSSAVWTLGFTDLRTTAA
jgi:hypothetical protein